MTADDLIEGFDLAAAIDEWRGYWMIGCAYAAGRAERERERADDLQALVDDLKRTIADDRSLEAWRAAHEALNASGIEGGPGLVARIGALVDREKAYDEVVREDLLAAYAVARAAGAQFTNDAPTMVEVVQACFVAGVRSGKVSRQRGWTS